MENKFRQLLTSLVLVVIHFYLSNFIIAINLFGFDTHDLSIAPFLQQPTIVQHSKLLETDHNE